MEPSLMLAVLVQGHQPLCQLLQWWGARMGMDLIRRKQGAPKSTSGSGRLEVPCAVLAAPVRQWLQLLLRGERSARRQRVPPPTRSCEA
mmetsp:Transcript_90355/g.264354  ORF Transcript_90355/g.264354 Transcript_90355/m.264354 type:complete len:89 (-) Transcript_90355:907-1173(-)